VNPDILPKSITEMHLYEIAERFSERNFFSHNSKYRLSLGLDLIWSGYGAGIFIAVRVRKNH
jgi:hypothetical protein